MAITRILEALSVDGGNNRSTDAHESHDLLLIPTPDERASFYLRAVHGDGDFSSEEHANARDLILDAMAADIAARSEWRSHALLQDISMLPDNALLQGLEPVTAPRLLADQHIKHQPIDESDDVSPDLSIFSEQVLQLPRLSWPVERGFLYGVATVCSAAVLAAALGYWAGTMSQTAQAPDITRLSGQSTHGSEPPLVAEAQRELASVLNVAQLTPDQVAELLKRGQDLIAQGRFRVARTVLEPAAEAKNASAAFALGRTYDPLIERSAVRPDAPPDMAMARIWYEKAKDLGSTEAAQRLTQLPASVPATRPSPK
jgi:hypothetical protein